MRSSVNTSVKAVDLGVAGIDPCGKPGVLAAVLVAEPVQSIGRLAVLAGGFVARLEQTVTQLAVVLKAQSNYQPAKPDQPRHARAEDPR